MRARGILLVLAGVAVAAAPAMAQTRVDNAVLAAVGGAKTLPAAGDVASQGLNVAANAVMDVSLSLETDTAGRAIFVEKVFITRSRCILPPQYIPLFQAGVGKAVSWCAQAEAANFHLEKPVGSYTVLMPNRKWEGLALGIANVQDAGCRVRVSGYSSGPGGGACSIYIRPSAAEELSAALSRVARQAALLRDQADRAAQVYQSLR